ncbi:MAG TPA: YceI family protein [Pyrinomonadaceae bacterium]|jgi:polyisoprenoid-binding protein YceI|nr:YceI family protein [Pyrinomonadaceae bacterium]
MNRQTFFYAAVFSLLVCCFSFFGLNRLQANLPAVSFAGNTTFSPKIQTLARYQIDAAQSQFMVHAFRGGLLYFKGHDHFIKVGDFSGTVELTPSVVSPATLNMSIKTDSLEETGADFTAEQKGIIKKELNEIVMESAKYPEITFHSTEVTGTLNGAAYQAKIGGDITLHGVTKHITIPATVTFDGETLRAKGEFKLNRKDFNVNATDAFHGTVRVKHDVKFTFDIAAHKV